MKNLLLSIAACVAASVQAITWVTYDSVTLPSGVKEIKINNDVDTSIDNSNQSDAQGFNLCCVGVNSGRHPLMRSLELNLPCEFPMRKLI